MKSLSKTVSHLCLSGVSTYPINNIFVRPMASKGLLNREKCGVGFKKRVKPLRIKFKPHFGPTHRSRFVFKMANK